MVTFYALFYKATFSSDVLVFPGILSNRPEVNSHTCDYSFHGRSSNYEFRDSPLGTLPIMNGKNDGLFTRTITIRARNGMTASFRDRGLFFHHKWTLATNSGEFTWRSDWTSRHFVLTDQSGNQVAKFNRTKSRMSKVGDLIIYGEHNDSVKALIVFSCCIMHQTVRSSERGGAAAGAAGASAAAASGGGG
ncbi:hypothetical protein EV183_005662, partial [Coemansia sp. RSA 2336]